MDELIDVCDEDDNVVGQAMKSHVLANGLWHRVARVLIFNSKGEIFLQLRSETKELHPGKWDVGVAGHVGVGEDYIDTAIREAVEEAGLDISKERLELVMAEKEAGVYGRMNEKIFSRTYFARFDGDAGEIKIQEEELQMFKFIGIEELEAERKSSPGKFSPHSEKYWQEITSEAKKRFARGKQENNT